MSNIVPANIQIPAHLASRVGVPSTLSAALTSGLPSSMDFPRISIKASRFRVIDGDTETVLESTTLNAIIVGANSRLSKTWYAKLWTPDSEPQAPDCYSLDGIAPDAQANSPQSNLCASCAHNAWGSKVTPTGQQIKACSDTKRLAIVAADDAAGSVYLLSVTPAALKGLNQYQKELSVRGIPPEIVKTKIAFDTDASFPKLKFGFGGFLDADTQQVVDGLFGSEQVKAITGEAVKRLVATAPTPTPTPVAPKPALKAAPVVEDTTPAPKATAPKHGFGAPAKAAPAKAAPAKAAPAPVAVQAATSLADEIAALIGEVDADDA